MTNIHPVNVFFFHQNISSPLSPLSSSWLNPELLQFHRGKGLELEKEVGWVEGGKSDSRENL